MRSFALVPTVLALVLSPFSLFGTVNALPLLDDIPSDNADMPDLELAAPEQLQLSPGTPASTTPTDLKPQGAKLTWTATGNGQTQDTYDVRVTRTSETDGANNLTGEMVAHAEALASAEFTVDGLPEGPYFWQVRSCAIEQACNAWSAVYPLTLDGTAPWAPIAAVTSGQYDQTVVITGTAEAFSTISVTAENHACTTQAGSDGVWTCSFEDEFDYGVYVAAVVSSDKAGNQATMQFEFKVKELFVAPPIATEELPPVLEIAPAGTTPENKVYQQPISIIDSVNSGEVLVDDEQTAPEALLTTDGGIVQSSENGWQVFGMPWFVWLGSLGSMFAGWWAMGWPMPRRLGSVLSL